MLIFFQLGLSRFLLTRLMRGVTIKTPARQQVGGISTHTPHARRDMIQRKSYRVPAFLLTRLMRGVTLIYLLI